MSLVKHKTGWRAFVERAMSDGTRRRASRLFDLKADAAAWKAETLKDWAAEAEGTAGQRKTLRDALRRYATEVAPQHKGGRWELVRLNAIEAQPLPLDQPIGKLTAAQINDWKRFRLSVVKASSVVRDLSLLGGVLTAARREWGWLKTNPIGDVRRPTRPASRERLVTASEQRSMLRALGYKPGMRPANKLQEVAYMMLLALRTGMRAGELLDVRVCDIGPHSVTLPATKNGTIRLVPVGAKTARLLRNLGAAPSDSERKIFSVSSESRDALWRKTRAKAGLTGFTFHDLRHTAATRIGRTVGQPGRLSFPEFCKVFGWRDPKNALIYVNPSDEELARKM